MVVKPIPTLKKVIFVGGKVFWSDNRQRIDLKKPIRDLLSPEARYIMELCLSKEKLLERTKELIQGDVMPVLLYFTKEEPLNSASSLLKEVRE
ncbi:hypothetical protein KY346_00105 [Candidatus Woesearchaeota archaeon]|nr:hypothetical protein [Candidatus Woesearchaeota archaeon]